MNCPNCHHEIDLHQHDDKIREEGYCKGCDDSMMTVAEVRAQSINDLISGGANKYIAERISEVRRPLG